MEFTHGQVKKIGSRFEYVLYDIKDGSTQEGYVGGPDMMRQLGSFREGDWFEYNKGYGFGGPEFKKIGYNPLTGEV